MKGNRTTFFLSFFLELLSGIFVFTTGCSAFFNVFRDNFSDETAYSETNIIIVIIIFFHPMTLQYQFEMFCNVERSDTV